MVVVSVVLWSGDGRGGVVLHAVKEKSLSTLNQGRKWTYPKELLGDDNAAKGIFCTRSGVADYMRVSQGDTICLSWVDTGIHAGDYVERSISEVLCHEVKGISYQLYTSLQEGEQDVLE